mgnify:FL=1
MKIGDMVRLRPLDQIDVKKSPGFIGGEMEFEGFQEIMKIQDNGRIAFHINGGFWYFEEWLTTDYMDSTLPPVKLTIEEEIKLIHEKLDKLIDIFGACEQENA